MTIQEWNDRYLGADDSNADPTPLLVKWTPRLIPGRALDLACGAGRNPLHLAANGWSVTAIDGAAAAIEYLRQRAARCKLEVTAAVADLTSREFEIEPESWDLISTFYYLQRDLIPRMQQGVRNNGYIIAIVHIPEPGEAPSYKRAAPGELRGYFDGWEILHYYEGPSRDPAHHRSVAEIVAKWHTL